MNSYELDMLQRAKDIIAAKEAVEAFIQGPGGSMMGPVAFADTSRCLGHLTARYADSLELVLEKERSG